MPNTQPVKQKTNTQSPASSIANQNYLEKINKVSLRLLVPLTPIEAYKVIVDEAIKLVDGLYGSIILLVDGKLERVYSSSESGYSVINRKKGNTYKAFHNKQIIIADITKTGKHHPQLREMGIKTTVFIPLSWRGESLGVLTINSTKEIGKGLRDLDLMKLLGSMATLAIKKAHTLSELKQSLETRDLFISLAAHEFRTPITTINVYAELLRNKLKNSKDEATARWVEIMSWEATRLTNLVDELLTINRIKSGQLQYVWKEVSLREILGRVFLDFSLANPSRKVIFSDLPENVSDKTIGDFDKLLQVFINLLNNAAKFSETEKEIVVNLKYRNACFMIEVIDSGQGIRKEDLPRIFEGFYKGAGNEKQGMGLGLFLAKNVIDNHRGEILVESEFGKGTKFTVRIPKVKI